MILLPLLCGLGLAAAQAQTFTNPVIYSDFADNDIFLGPDDIFYYSASNMHYSPGAPLLASHDLVNWELISHSVPSLDFGDNYNMAGNTTAYRGGTWASTLRYRDSDSTWYWVGCVNFWTTYVYTADSPTGPWSQSASFQPCFYDCGLLIDDDPDETMYVVYGSNNVSIAQLAPDGLSVAKTQPVFNYPSLCTGMEGNRLYKRNGTYYVLDDCPSDSVTLIWKSDSIWGPWTSKPLVNKIAGPIAGSGTPIQGSLVETADDEWYFMSFSWAYPAGRMPVLAPVTWADDGFPVLTEVDGAWGVEYPLPMPAEADVPAWTGVDTFQGTELGPAWEWNHNPDAEKYVVDDGLTLMTATVTDDLYHARNTLTHRVYGEFPVGTVEIDFSAMADGDVCGFAAFRDQSAWIGVVREGGNYTVTARQGLTQDSSTWATTSTGSVVGTAPIEQKKIWLRVSMDARASGSKLADFAYSLDGAEFVPLGDSFTLNTGWEYFIGYRFGIFNYATVALGGSIDVLSFDDTASA